MNHQRSEREAMVLELLALNPAGMRSREIAPLMGLTRSHMWSVMPALVDVGKVLMIGTPMRNGLIGGCHVRYCLPEHKALAEVEAGSNNRRIRRQRLLRLSKFDPAYTDGELDELESIPDTPMVQRRVPASECAPLRPRGPASVWQLGAA